MRKPEDFIGRSKWEVDTPCLLLDRKLLQQNMLTMQAFVKNAGKKLRPHSKTHKCSKMAKLQMQTGSIGICTAKISEAKVLTHKGVHNVLVTSPVTTPYKIAVLASCFHDDPEITVVIDNLENAQMLNDACQHRDHYLNVLIDVDAGAQRTGVSFKTALSFAKKIDKFQYLNLKGIQCYAGHTQHIKSYSERKNTVSPIIKAAGKLLREFHAAGLSGDILSVGGTGTYDIDAEIAEVTEIQPGSYMVMDADYYAIESKHAANFVTFKPALTLLSTVISNNHASHVTIDAGLKALYYDATPPRVLHPDQNLQYVWGFGDEHGKLLKPADYPLELNSKIELMVAHCDPTINLFDHYYVTQNDTVIDVWPIDLRGKTR